MVTLLGVFVIGAASAALLWRATAPVFEHPMLARTNVHGRPVPTAGGLVIVLVLFAPLVMVRIAAMVRWDGPDELFSSSWVPVLTAGLGFGILGLVDDLLGDGSSRGFRGHLGALATGKLTTGALKLIGGGVVAFVAVSQTSLFEPRWAVFVDAALVALAANLANLFDRAPGRVTKVSVVAGLVLFILAPMSVTTDGASVFRPPTATLFVLGAAVGVLVPELRERMMLGDTGANAVGAALGLGVVMAFDEWTRVGVALVLLALNLASEKVSFSRVIASTPGLRQFDQLGRARE